MRSKSKLGATAMTFDIFSKVSVTSLHNSAADISSHKIMNTSTVGSSDGTLLYSTINTTSYEGTIKSSMLKNWRTLDFIISVCVCIQSLHQSSISSWCAGKHHRAHPAPSLSPLVWCGLESSQDPSALTHMHTHTNTHTYTDNNKAIVQVPPVSVFTPKPNPDPIFYPYGYICFLKKMCVLYVHNTHTNRFIPVLWHLKRRM